LEKIDRSLALWEEYGEFVLMSTSYQDILVDHAKGSAFYDVDGNEYIDLSSGQICALVGHNHPELLQQLIAQMSRVMHTGTHFLSEPILRASKKLAEIAPRGLRKTMFLSTGAEANEAAFRIAKKYTGREGIVAFTHGYAG
jgi:2,2-dialkylglycine decarboxylase (pyruvate)